jgi:glycosyltransferase involved in cell wall biosynthesis
MDKKIKVFRLVTSEFSLKAHLTNTLKRFDNSFQFFVLGDGVEGNKNLYPNIIFINVPIKRNISPFYDLISLFYLIFLSIKYRPTVLHTIMPKAGLIGAIAGYIAKIPKRYHTFTGQIWINFPTLKKKIFISLDKLICYLNTENFTDSRSQSDFLLLNNIINKDKTKIKYFLNGSLSGVDINIFSPDTKFTANSISLRNKYNITKDDFVILYLARKSLDKGALDFLQIVTHLNQINKKNKFKFLFIGPDESNAEVEKYFKNYGTIVNLINIGTVSNHHLYISISNLLCMPSHKEGFGSIVIDCASMGVPCIGYNIVGLIDAIIDQKTGILVNENDIMGMVNSIINLKNDSEKLLELTTNCIENTKLNYDADLFYSELKRLYLS